jgi:hypothetical protein
MKFQFARIVMSCALALIGFQHMNAQSTEVFGGFTTGQMKPEGTDQPTMNGWNASFTRYVTPRFGITGDVAGYYGTAHPTDSNGTSNPLDLRQYSFMAGPQFRLLHTQRFDTSVRALFGGAYGYLPGMSESSNLRAEDSGFSSLFGGNFDLHLTRKVALRFSPGIYLTQFGGETQKNFRFSVGPVFHFGGGEE